MQINNVNGAGTQAGQSGAAQATDSFTKNIERQIAEIQKEIQEVSQNQELSMEEKVKKRQELNAEITELNMQLRQHQIEMRKEKQQGTSMEDLLGGKKQNARKNEESTVSISTEGMQALISADTAKDMSDVQGHVATAMEAKARTLKGEIRADAGRGGNVEDKIEALESVEEKAQNATGSQMELLADASKEAEKAAKKEQTEDTEETEEKTVFGDDEEELLQTDYKEIDIRL